MTARAMIMLFVLTIVLRTGFMFAQRYSRRLNAFYDDWNGKESPEKRRHRECLEHIARMEKELGITPTEQFYAKPMPMSALQRIDRIEETYEIVGKHTSPDGVVTDTYGITRHPVPTPSCSCAICADFTKMALSARRLRNELVQSYGIPT